MVLLNNGITFGTKKYIYINLGRYNNIYILFLLYDEKMEVIKPFCTKDSVVVR